MSESEDNPYSHSHEKLPPIENILVAIAPDQVVWKHGWEAMIFGTPTQAAPPSELSLRHIPHEHSDVAMPNGKFVQTQDVLIPRGSDGKFTGTWFTLDNHYPLDERRVINTPPILTDEQRDQHVQQARKRGTWRR